jgi:hypothetical protein
MPVNARIVIIFLFSLLLSSTAISQTQPTKEIPLPTGTERLKKQSSAPAPSPILIATAGSQKVRYASLGEVHQTRLQVFSPDGAQVFDSDFHLGNFIEWQLLDQQGQRLSAGSYLFLVTIKDFSEHLTQKYGTAILEQEQVYLEQTNRAELPHAQTTALESNKQSEVLLPVDRLGAAGLNREIASIIPPVNTATDVQVSRTVESSQLTTVTESANAIAGTGTQNKIARWIDNGGTLGDSNLFQNADGKIGVGTSAPNFNLDVNRGISSADVVLGIDANASNIHSPMIYFRNTGSAISKIMSAKDLQFQNISGSPLLYLKTNGNLGIGTATPNFRLDVNRGTTADSVLGIDANGSNIYSPTLYFRNTGTAISKIMSSRDLQFQNVGGNSLLYLKTSGNVGIGTANPQSKLDVVGDISVTGNAIVAGNIAAKYQDVAEWVTSRQQLVAGTVVSLDVTQTNAVVSSHRAYDTQIAGVVSAQPGLILGEGGAGKVMVATTGRVKVKVDASKHPIRIGDLLVTSNRPGVAMRSQRIRAGRALIHRPGTIIGKALEPLARGEGEILVLLSLQ